MADLMLLMVPWVVKIVMADMAKFNSIIDSPRLRIRSEPMIGVSRVSIIGNFF